MSDISFAPQQKKTAVSVSSKNRTPRIIKSKTHGMHAFYSQTQILPSISNATNPEQNQTTLLKTLFNAFIKTLSKLLSHNSASASFRNSISNQSQETQRLFGVFLQQTVKQFATSPVLQRGARPSDSSTKGAFQFAMMPFLKMWSSFACNCCELQFSGPESIRQTIIDNFKMVEESLENVSHFTANVKVTVHNTPQKCIHSLQQQISALESEAEDRLRNPENIEGLKETAGKVKNYSRLLNDSFANELSNCGIGVNDLVRIRQKIYTSCCDIIAALKGAYLFEQDMNTLLGALDEFQDSLTIVLEKLDIPTTFIYRREIISRATTSPKNSDDEEAEEDANVFASYTKPSELCKAGINDIHMIFNNVPRLTCFLNQMQLISTNIEQENEKLIAEQNNNNLLMEKEKEKANKKKEELKEKINNYEEEIARLKDICAAQEKEIENLRTRQKDNEFKKCLRNVAKKLGGVLQEEEVNIIPEDEDDQLISKVDALTVYVVERKCQNCVLHKKEEEKMRALLSVVVDPDEENISFFDFITLVRERFDSLSAELDSLKKKKLELEQDCRHYQNGFKDIIGLFGKESNDYNDIVDISFNMVKNELEARSKEFNAIVYTKDNEMNSFADSICSKFEEFLDQDELKVNGTKVQKASLLSAKARDKMLKIQEKYNECEKINIEVRDRLAKFMNVPAPVTEMENAPLILVKQLESMPNPLTETLNKASSLNKFLFSSMGIINNRFRGVTMTNDSVPANNMSPETLVNATIKLLEKFQDMYDNTLEELETYKHNYETIREAMENIDLKLHKFLGEKDINLKDIKDRLLIERTDDFVSKITSKQVSPDFIAKADIDKLFADVYDLVPVTTRSDPMKYIPEVNNAFISLNGSIMALKPFASILNSIFSTFDCKYASFLPGSAQCKSFRQQIMQLHTSLNSIVPAKINSLVFLVISRFTSLLSLLFSALTSMSYSSEDEQSKCFLFSLQQENERLNSILDSNGIKY